MCITSNVGWTKGNGVIAPDQVSGIPGYLMTQGLWGVCVLVLGFAVIFLWRQYAARTTELIAAEVKFRSEVTEISEKFRVALEKTNQVLDAAIKMAQKGGRA